MRSETKSFPVQSFRVTTCKIVLVTMLTFSINIMISSSTPSATFSCSGRLLSPQMTKSARRGDNGFRLKIQGEPGSYRPGAEYIVTLQSTRPSTFRKFFIRAENTQLGGAAGRFQPVNEYTSQMQPLCATNTISHAHIGKKTVVRVRWIAPPRGSACVTLSASVVEKGQIWFKDSGQLSLEICERQISVEGTNNVNSSETKCCACGGASYRMTFYGLWSPATHPKDYPEFSTHWSNVVGASHSGEYTIWKFGGYASEAVQKVAEWGWSGQLETDIAGAKRDGSALSLIKTDAQWPAFEPQNLRAPPHDEFETDTRRHLVSLLTMLGPSPDWNVGISGESMCTVGCGWVGERSFNLTPWDAGTDSGVTYTSPNSPTSPHEKIRTLTAQDHPQSPFYRLDGGEIEPVARLVIRRTYLNGKQCGESEELPGYDVTPVAVDSVEESINRCTYGEWTNWSNCGVTCGWGIKTRRRGLEAGDVRACAATMQKEICKGLERCSNSENSTACLYSDWTTWSGCSMTCGKAGLVFRTRVLMWPSEPGNCRQPLKEMLPCDVEACRREDGCQFTPWSRWMPCPVTCGAGRTFRKRSPLILGDVKTCNNMTLMRESSTCMTSLSCKTTSHDFSQCQYGPWTGWQPCPVTCGVGRTMRKRVLLGTNHACGQFKMESSKCMTSSWCDAIRSEDCNYGLWSEWMPCSATCGVGATLRKKFLIRGLAPTNPNGAGSEESCEPLVMERASCHQRSCERVTPSVCTYSAWSRWMPCTATCGKGETLRKRFLNQTASRDQELDTTGCQPFEMETNRCMVTCPSSHSPREPCRVSSWQPWGRCSQTCGRGGHVTRVRDVSIGCDDAERRETKRCAKLPGCARDCVMSAWSNWTSCSVGCDETRTRKAGVRIRRRGVLVRAKFGGEVCGSQKEKSKCTCNGDNAPTPIDGSF